MTDIQNKVNSVFDLLDRNSPEKIDFLRFNNAFELLISVILSAQTTDNQVNKVTETLFETYPTPSSLASAAVEDVEQIIRSTGFFKRKAKHIIAASGALVDRFDSIVPLEMKDLITIPGVGRKSANVIIGRIAHKGAAIVDTHFMRVVNRLGIVDSSNPLVIEMTIKDLLAENKQYRFSMVVNLHGRRVCFARTPSCDTCILSGYCDYLVTS